MAKAKSYARLGSDLALTRYTGVPASLPLLEADSWGTLDLQAVPGKGTGLQKSTEARDLGAISGRDNLGQALILRLLTHEGRARPARSSRIRQPAGGADRAIE